MIAALALTAVGPLTGTALRFAANWKARVFLSVKRKHRTHGEFDS